MEHNFSIFNHNHSQSNETQEEMFNEGVWNKVLQLVVLALVSTAGTMGNIFVISAVIVIPLLKTKGNAFLVSLSIANLLITSLIIPASCVAILSGSRQSDDFYYCNFQWEVTVVYLFVTSLTFMSISLENLAGVSNIVTYDRCCGSKVKIICVVLLSWVVSICVAGVQEMYNYGPDFCKNNFSVSPSYHIPLVVILLGIPTLVTLVAFVKAMAIMKEHDSQTIDDQKDAAVLFSPPLTDYKLLKSNFIVFGVYILLWLPFCVLVGMGIANRLPVNFIDGVWWLSLSNGCIHSYTYAATNPYFREAFNKLFYYCCCKTHVSFSRIRRQDTRPHSDDCQSQALRVHIIQGLNLYAQRKENTSKSGNYSGKPNCTSSRAAYEL